jgi:hypothetical protein
LRGALKLRTFLPFGYHSVACRSCRANQNCCRIIQSYHLAKPTWRTQRPCSHLCLQPYSSHSVREVGFLHQEFDELRDALWCLKQHKDQSIAIRTSSYVANRRVEGGRMALFNWSHSRQALQHWAPYRRTGSRSLRIFDESISSPLVHTARSQSSGMHR